MRMQQEDADPLAKVDPEDDSAATKQTLEGLSLLSDEKELERYLSFGKWGLSDADIVRLQKDEEMKQRVSYLLTYFSFTAVNHNSPRNYLFFYFLFFFKKKDHFIFNSLLISCKFNDI